MDGNNWIIGNDGTNGTNWAETIDGADRIHGTFLCKGDQESHVIPYISDKNGTSKLNKLTIFDKKWNFWNLLAMFDK